MMNAYRESLGKVFISYSSLDRTFVRKLVARLKKAVLVIVSKNSIKSKWLKYELNIATERMVKGTCRLIPVVIDDASLPPEVQGLMYADLRKSFRYGIKGIISALDHEAYKSAQSEAFYRKADMIVEDVFGSRSYVSAGSEYKSHDYESVSVPVECDEGEETNITYETAQDYLGRAEPLSDHWWSEYQASRDDYAERLHLVLTERPLGFSVAHCPKKNVFVHRNMNIPLKLLYGATVVVDLSKTKRMEERIAIVRDAREVLISLAKELQELTTVAN